MSLVITDCHHSASLVMPIWDPRMDFFLFHPQTYGGYIYDAMKRLFPQRDDCKICHVHKI